MNYVDVLGLLGPMPVNGSLFDADCVIALSFARNSVPDNELPRIRQLAHALKGNDAATIGHISRDFHFDPGLPNNYIAVNGKFCIDYAIPLIAQWEIVVALFQRRGADWIHNLSASNRLFALWPPDRPAYRTIEVLEDAFRVTQEHGWQRPLLLAHDYHMPRVAMLAQHFWPEFIIGFSTTTREFDPKSAQPQCASARQWYTYEVKARAHHFLHGWCFGHFTSGRF